MVKRPKKDLVEVFGYAPDDLSNTARSLWNLEACPFINKPCSKANHDKTIVYGTCSVTSPFGDCIICPNRLYEKNYSSLRRISEEVFGLDYPFLMFEEYIPQRQKITDCIVALGQNSGKEVKIGKSLSMDWVLAHIRNGKLMEYTGVEVQSIDITGNYRDSWHSYKNLNKNSSEIPSSQHGMNWANVHKRLIPQIIRKGSVYSKSKFVNAGIYFVVPEIVYLKFEEIIGSDIPLVHTPAPDTITIHTYGLSEVAMHGEQRETILKRNIKFSLDEFAERFITGPNLPSGGDLDLAVMKVLGLKHE